MTAAQATKPVQMSTRRPRNQYMEGFSTWIGRQEYKVKNGEQIHQPVIEDTLKNLSILQKRLEHVKNGKVYTPPVEKKPVLVQAPKTTQPAKTTPRVVIPKQDLKDAVEEVISSQLPGAVREILEEFLGPLKKS